MPIPTPHYELAEARLDNGLRVVVNEDHSVPVAAVNIWYDVGSRHERPGLTGFAHLFEHLMFEGSAHVGKTEHFGYVQGVGGTLNATTWCDRTNYFETTPSNHLDLMLWLEADRMAALAVTQESFDNQREVVKNERRQRYDNQPYGTWIERMHALAFPEGHPYHHSTIGSMADLDAAGLADAQEFYATYYAPNNAVLTIVGDVEAEAALASVERFLGEISAREGIPAPPDGTVPDTARVERREEIVEDVPTARCLVAYRTPPFGTEEHNAAVLLAAVLGSGRGSRLHRELVLRRRLAQPADGAMASTWDFVGGAGLLLVDAVAREGVDAEVVEEALHEVAGSVAKDGIDDAELERAKALVSSEWLHQLSGPESRADTFSQYATLLGDPKLVNAHLPEMLAVTADEVRAMARRILVPRERAVLTFVPEAEQPGEAAA